MRKVYRRRRLAALAVLAVLFLAALALFGALGTQASSQVQGDQLGPDGETRAEYIARVSGSDIPDAPAYALVTFDEDLPPVAAAAAVAAAEAPSEHPIARALVANPGVVFADEPTGALDQATGHEVMQMLTTIVRQAGASLVMVTHDPKVADWMQRRVEIRDGIIHDDRRLGVIR